MGLDMYLEADRFLSEYFKEEKPLIEKINALVLTPAPLTIDPDAPQEAPGGVSTRVRARARPPTVCGVTLRVGQWRKANAIHQWFVEHCQEGVDECQRTHVTRDQLQALARTCLLVLEQQHQAPEVLPTQAGFFFGGTDYDQYYFEDLEHTLAIIEQALRLPEDDWDFYYHSSW